MAHTSTNEATESSENLTSKCKHKPNRNRANEEPMSDFLETCGILGHLLLSQADQLQYNIMIGDVRKKVCEMDTCNVCTVCGASNNRHADHLQRK